MGKWTVGRSKDCDIVINFPSVSRRHATFKEAGHDIEICDLDSSGGTHILQDGNWARVIRATIAPDDSIKLGDYKTTTRALLATAGLEFAIGNSETTTSALPERREY
jgi:pSer/pThr/pTyr-binding forkhead associated (FHA) protein